MIPPTQFHFELDSWAYEYNSVKLQRGRLVCKLGDDQARFAKPWSVQPTEERWQEFWEAVNAARVWEWQRTYETVCLDGTCWSLRLHWGDKQVKSEGFNAYPGGNKTEYTPDSEFGIFETAVRKLIGHRRKP